MGARGVLGSVPQAFAGLGAGMFATPPPILGSSQCLPKLTSGDKEGHVCQVRTHDLGLSLSLVVLMLYFKSRL